MRRIELEPFVGKVVALDMLNRERPVCRITDIDDHSITVKDPVIYIPVPSGAGMQVQGISYAGPLFDVKKLRIAFEHVVAILDVPTQMEQAYIRHSSGLVTDTKPKIIVP